MRRLLILLATLGVAGILGWQVMLKERILKDGAVVLLALAPADPRSIMQGDYMTLRWAMTRDLANDGAGQRIAVLALDGQRVGTFRRFGAGEPLGPDEIAFLVGADAYGNAAVAPTSFLFEEGRADAYARARFGIFRVDARGQHLLTGLADDKAQPILAR